MVTSKASVRRLLEHNLHTNFLSSHGYTLSYYLLFLKECIPWFSKGLYCFLEVSVHFCPYKEDLLLIFIT